MRIDQRTTALLAGAVLCGLAIGSAPLRGTDPVPGWLQVLAASVVVALAVGFAARSDRAVPDFVTGVLLAIGVVSVVYAPLSGEISNPATMTTWAAMVATQGFTFGVLLAVVAVGVVDVATERTWAGDRLVPGTKADWWAVTAFVGVPTAAFLGSVVAPDPVAGFLAGVVALGCAVGAAGQSGVRRSYLLLAGVVSLGVLVSTVSYDGGLWFVTIGVVAVVAAETVGERPTLSAGVAVWGGLLLGTVMFATGGPV